MAMRHFVSFCGFIDKWRGVRERKRTFLEQVMEDQRILSSTREGGAGAGGGGGGGGLKMMKMIEKLKKKKKKKIEK